MDDWYRCAALRTNETWIPDSRNHILMSICDMPVQIFNKLPPRAGNIDGALLTGAVKISTARPARRYIRKWKIKQSDFLANPANPVLRCVPRVVCGSCTQRFSLEDITKFLRFRLKFAELEQVYKIIKISAREKLYIFVNRGGADVVTGGKSVRIRQLNRINVTRDNLPRALSPPDRGSKIDRGLFCRKGRSRALKKINGATFIF